MLIPFSFFMNSNFAKAFNCTLIFLNTDKDNYYINENITIDASWDLNYNDDIEYAYVQIQIFDIFDFILWNTSKYDKIGSYEHDWTIFIENLNLNFTNYSNLIFVKFFYYYYHEGIENPEEVFLQTIEITVIKRELSCELFGFRDHMRVGENLSFNVRFYDLTSDNSSNLINQEILFEIISNNSLLHRVNFTLNQMGIIEVSISSITDLRLGRNFLIFKIINTDIYNNTEFIYEILLEKKLLFIDIIEFKEVLNERENLEIKILFYYFSNDAIQPLNDTSIILKIFYVNNLTFMDEYKTDKNGILYINITQESFNSEKNKNLIIKIIFNGDYYLENKTVSLNIRFSKKIVYSQLTIFSLSIILLISSIIIVLIFKNLKKNKEKILTEITFRY